MSEYRNEPIYVLAEDYTALGLTAEQAAHVADSGWHVVNAPRPLSGIWQDDTGEYIQGLRWEQPGALIAWFFAAGDPEGDVNGRTMVEAWNRDDAVPVQLITEAELEAIMDAKLCEHDYSLELYRELEGKRFDLVRLANDQGVRVFDKR